MDYPVTYSYYLPFSILLVSPVENTAPNLDVWENSPQAWQQPFFKVHCRMSHIPFSNRVQGRGRVGGSVWACERASYYEMRNKIKSLFLFIKVIVSAWKSKLLVEVAEV